MDRNAKEKEKILGLEPANKEVIHRQETEKCKNEKEINSQIAYLHKLKEKINECKGTLEEQEQMKQINNAEIEEQSNQLQEQKTLISTQKEELFRQKLETKKNESQIKTQATVLYELNEEVNDSVKMLQKQENMKQIIRREIDQQIALVQEQKIKINTQKEEIHTQELEKMLNEENIKCQTALLHKIKEEMNECEEKLQIQMNVKQINEREIGRQLIQIQENESIINTQKEQIHQQKNDTLTHRGIIKKTRRKMQTLKTILQTKEKEQQMKKESVQKQLSELEKQKKLHEQNVNLSRIEVEHMKHREIRSKEEDLHVLQNIHDQLVNRHSSSNYTQDNQTELNIKDDLEKIIEKMKIELQRSLEEPAGLNLTQDPVERTKHQSSKKLEQGDATHDSTRITASTVRKVCEENPHVQNNFGKSTLGNLLELLQHLSLESFYPNKLTTETFLSVSSSNKEQSATNIAFSNILLNFSSGFETTAKEIQPSSTKKDEILNEKHKSHNGIESIHPVDIMMAMFHCADDYLRQYIVSMLSSSQYALPLLLPNAVSADIELPLWTFQEIKKTWKLTDGSSKTVPVCQIETPMVFFCRLGSVSMSKSQLLNSLINPKHDTFFHRDSPGSSETSLFKEGLVEIAWYCPVGNDDDPFSECIAFCNLHGDAVDHRKQTNFLSENAAINIVIMQNKRDKVLLEKLHKSPKPLICLVSDQKKGPLNISKGLDVTIGLRGITHTDLLTQLLKAINICLQKCKYCPTFCLGKSSKLAKDWRFRVHKDNTEYLKGKARALNVMKLLEGEEISQIKARFLPCQGKLWHEWSKKNKELHRLHGGNEQTKEDILTEMNQIRAKQQGISLRFMKDFVKILLSGSTVERRFFIHWIQKFIDDRFSEDVSQLRLKYNSRLLDIQKLRNIQGKTEELKEGWDELDKLSEELDTMTLGLEHFFREMGQIYEAWARVPEEMGSDVSNFPTVAADLLISGHPLELMDGDAAHVPLTWIESVLDKVIERLGDQRVFVLSVLGLQSSGKSTMLNTMFGLQFAVSAGGCTRGAFMQLIRVKEEAKEELKFDYLLVVDSEGLNGLELAVKPTISNDKTQLITFVTRLANMTLMNIFGENPAEIKWILQIAIKAILKMNKVHLKPSCMFVHQNITDLTTAENKLEGKGHLQNKLDEITVSVAQKEGCDAQYFSDLFKFSIQTDVHYIAPLQERSSPMASSDLRYSENVKSLKHAVLRGASEQDTLKISEFKDCIKDLWTAMLNEDCSIGNSLDKL